MCVWRADGILTTGQVSRFLLHRAQTTTDTTCDSGLKQTHEPAEPSDDECLMLRGQTLWEHHCQSEGSFLLQQGGDVNVPADGLAVEATCEQVAGGVVFTPGGAAHHPPVTLNHGRQTTQLLLHPGSRWWTLTDDNVNT